MSNIRVTTLDDSDLRYLDIGIMIETARAGRLGPGGQRLGTCRWRGA